MSSYPGILRVRWLRANLVLVSFSTGKTLEIALPIESAKKARIVGQGTGLDPGDGMEISATRLYTMRVNRRRLP